MTDNTAKYPSLGREASAGDSLTVEYSDVEFFIRSKDKKGPISRTILHNISGTIEAGKLTAIIGPSGCGKSTLLNVLSGRMAPDSVPNSTLKAAVSLNGCIIDPVEYKQRFAYVMAEDSLYATTTPREAFQFVCKLRCPHLNEEQRNERTEWMIETLGLQSCADTYIGNPLIKGVSTGEKKRTAVGIELLPNPDVCFLDEPTTGLDSFTALELIRMTRKFADSGKTVVCVIHQPSSEVFELFDNVICMSKGYVVYHGPVAKLTDYFGARGYKCPADYNPSDYVMYVLQTISDEELEKLASSWKDKEQAAKNEIEVSRAERRKLELKPIRRAPLRCQLAGLFGRELKRTVRDPSVIMVRFGIAILMGILVGCLFYKVGDTGGVITSSYMGGITNLCVFGMMSAGPAMLISLPFDRPVILREYSNGLYSIVACVLSRLSIEFPLIAINSFILTTIIYFLEKFSGNYILLVFAIILLGASMSAMALSFGSAFKEVERAVELSFILFVPQILFSGFFVSINQIPAILRWAQWICAIKYAINISYIAEFKGKSNYLSVFETNNVDEDLLWMYVGLLLALVVGFTILSIVLLRWRSKSVF
jgi:ABC-type multidrug transport system ATPase subunit/ABC-type multidrug transport system permease subunit